MFENKLTVFLTDSVDGKVLEDMAMQVDGLQSRMMKKRPVAQAGDPVCAVLDHRQRYRLRGAKLRVYQQAKNKIRDAHCKFVKFVTEHCTGVLDRWPGVRVAS